VAPPPAQPESAAPPPIPGRRDALDRFVAAVRLISRLCGYFAAGLIGVGVGVVCHMVLVRYALNHHTIWQTDFVTYSLIAATFVGSPYVLMTRGHVNVDVLPLHAGPRGRWWLALFAAVVTLGFSVTLALLTFAFWKQAWDNHWVSDTMWRARLWIPYASMPIGLSVLSLQGLADLLVLLCGREAPFGMTSSGRKA
jgi:TRAP-type C4-dicarboxylate transport system permease small subunit